MEQGCWRLGGKARSSEAQTWTQLARQYEVLMAKLPKRLQPPEFYALCMHIPVSVSCIREGIDVAIRTHLGLRNEP